MGSAAKMANPRVPADVEKGINQEALEKFNRIWKQNLDREERLMRHWEWRGNKLPPFAIEPLPHERQRLGNGGMTPEQRALRKQWVMDQKLAPHEPVHIQALNPKNPFRRIYGAPWDALFNALRPALGDKYATMFRKNVPRFMLAGLAAWAGIYGVLYNPNTWETDGGWYMYTSRRPLLVGEEGFDELDKKPSNWFFSKGFLDRKVYTDDSAIVTSTTQFH